MSSSESKLLREVTPRSPLGRGIPLVLAAVLAMVTAVLVLVKHRAVVLAAASQRCTVRHLVAMGAYLRAAATGLLLGVALLLSVRFDRPSIGSVALIAAMTLMIYRRPTEPRRLRGPGRWLPIHPDEAFARTRTIGFGRSLDASTLAGKFVLFAWALGSLSLGMALFRTQPYLALLAFMATVIPWPMLLTGGSSDLPSADRDLRSRELSGLYRRLSADHRLRVHPVARFGLGDNCPDEVRLKLSVNTQHRGLMGLEIAAYALAGLVHSCLLIRVRDGSEAHCRWQNLGTSIRGRTADERVIVFAPTIATRARILATVQDLLALQTNLTHGYGDAPPRTDSNSCRSTASDSDTSKPSRSNVPGHATRAA